MQLTNNLKKHRNTENAVYKNYGRANKRNTIKNSQSYLFNWGFPGSSDG